MKFKKIYVLKIDERPYKMFFEHLIGAKFYLKTLYPNYHIVFTKFDNNILFIKIYHKNNFVGYITTEALF
jgi:hypothetical protein